MDQGRRSGRLRIRDRSGGGYRSCRFRLSELRPDFDNGSHAPGSNRHGYVSTDEYANGPRYGNQHPDTSARFHADIHPDQYRYPQPDGSYANADRNGSDQYADVYADTVQYSNRASRFNADLHTDQDADRNYAFADGSNSKPDRSDEYAGKHQHADRNPDGSAWIDADVHTYGGCASSDADLDTFTYADLNTNGYQYSNWNAHGSNINSDIVHAFANGHAGQFIQGGCGLLDRSSRTCPSCGLG